MPEIIKEYSLTNKERDLSSAMNTVIAEKGTFLSRFKSAAAATFISGASATIRPKSAISSPSRAGFSDFLQIFWSSLSFISAKFVSLKAAAIPSASESERKKSVSLIPSLTVFVNAFAVHSPHCIACSSEAPRSRHFWAIAATMYFVRFAVFTPSSCIRIRTARFQHWLLTRARGTPPIMADLGIPRSSRFRHETGKDWMM